MEYVYCGGRFDFDYLDADFEKKAEEDYRAILLNDVSKLLRNSGTVILSSRMAYIGPYYFESDGMLDQDIVETEKQIAIRKNNLGSLDADEENTNYYREELSTIGSDFELLRELR